MKEYTAPGDIVLDPAANLTDMVWANEREAPDAVVLVRRQPGGEWTDVTSRQFADEVRSVAAGLIASGVQQGDRVALMSKTRYEWTLCDYAIWTAGGVTVPIYETSSAEQVQWILADSGAVAAIIETDAHARIVDDVRGSAPALANVWQIDALGIDQLKAAGQRVDAATVEARHRALTLDSLATIIYTSGTTGRPKGCELTHDNFLFDVVSATSTGLRELFNEDASTLLFLPLAHVFARVIQCGSIYNRVRLGHTADIKNLVADLGTFRPTFILSVPRVFEKVYNHAKQKAHADGKGKIFDAAERVAIAYSEALERGSVGLGLRVQHAVFARLVYSKLLAALGGRTQHAVSGGAPLGARLGHFYRGVGLNVVEGYGLTETTAAATVNLPGQQKIGSVGRPIPGTSVRIADDGEILIKGRHVFARYFNNETATRDALEPDGWFHTGDIGELDDDGFLRITGRKKELLVTAGGKNVAPAVLEDRLRAHWLVSQCIVVGDAKPFIGCLVTIDPETFPTWLEQTGKTGTLADHLDDPELRAVIQEAVDDANRAVSAAEAIKSFRILPVDFTEEGGYLTPTLKLKRASVMKDFAAEVDSIYA